MPDNKTIKDRIILFIESQNMAVSSFEKRTGLSNGYIKRIKGAFGVGKIEDILKSFPNLSRNWLLTGEGEMLRTAKQKQKIKEVTQIGDDKIIIDKEVWEMMKAQAESLKAKDEQLSKVISMLEEQMNQREKVSVRGESAECADVVG